MNYTIQRLTPSDIALAKRLVSQIRGENGLLKPVEINDNYLIDLLAKPTFHIWVAMDGNIVAGGLTAYELPMFAAK